MRRLSLSESIDPKIAQGMTNRRELKINKLIEIFIEYN
tara:strand:- start:383 stop:496 length:114 start_codon:yes stop_codon:yes gene_type:complete